MPMKEKEILAVILDLSRSQGRWGRLYQNLMEIKEGNPEAYAETVHEWELEGFETPLDVVLFFEEGKHCKRKFWKIPVIWESYGVVEVEGNSPEEALENFKKHIDEYELPEQQHYVDDSFRLSSDDDKEVIAMIEKV